MKNSPVRSYRRIELGDALRRCLLFKQQILPPEDLTIIVNTGDDFEHLGLYISPTLEWVFTCIGLPIFVADLFAWGGPELVNAVFGRRAHHIYN